MKYTKKDFELFKKYCLEYQERFELMEWKILFEFKPLDTQQATSAFNLESHQVTIALSTKRDELEPNLRGLAKHEVLHVLLGRLGELAQYRYTVFRELDAAEHAIVNKLIKLIPN